ncbi:MAG: hypothetical protein JSU87_02695 [Gemmatimonadota bacterium]|nr:MAG: hypothetical protein JSU87_02695 [Gemmatimonadota bacterium]
MSGSRGRGPLVWLGPAIADADAEISESGAATVEAVVVEDDTFHVLSPLPVAREEHVPGGWLLRQALEARPATPGSVEIEEGEPILRLVAVVYDLQEEPPSREEWVAAALDGVLQEANRLGIRTLALPLLGCRLGGLSAERFAELYGSAIERVDINSLREVRMLTSGENLGIVAHTLRGLGVGVRERDQI